MKIATIVGARPQFIKAAAVSRAIAAHNRLTPDALPLTPHSSRFTEIIIHTGQHYDDGMSAIFFRELEIPEPAYNIGVGSGTHGKQTGEMLAAIEELLIAEKPDWVLVYGDTNSTLAGALAAAKLHIPVAHVEAGLRSFNRRMPEEINRVVTDHLSTLLFCPSQVSVDNLTAEGIAPNASHLTPNVLVVGDVMADALQFAAEKVSANSEIMKRLDLQPQSYILATVHRAENTDNPDRLKNIMKALIELAKKETVVLPLHPRTKKILEASSPSLLPPDASRSDASQSTMVRRAHHDTSSCSRRENESCPPLEGVGGGSPGAALLTPDSSRSDASRLPPHASLRIIDPTGYFDIIALEKSARMLLTDSGGMQKEAYWLKVPCITLRDETEWVETVASGWNILTGADRNRIVTAVRSFTPPANHPPLYGDGKAAEKILGVLCQKA